MAVSVFKNAKSYLHGYDISGDLNEMELAYSAAMLDDTTFGDDTESNKAGLKKVTVMQKGFWQSDGTDAVDDIIWDNFAVADKPLTLCPTDGTAGEPAYSVKAVLGTYTIGGKVGDLLPFTVNANGNLLVKGTVIENGVIDATEAGTGIQLGEVAEGQKLYAIMHVTAVSGTNPTLDVIIESDDNALFSSATTRVTFTQMDAIGSQWATPVSGAIADDDYWRASFTVGGTDDPEFTVVIVLAIQ